MKNGYKIWMAIASIIIILGVLPISIVFSEDVNVIMKNDILIKGTLIGKNTNEIIVQETGGKLDTIPVTNIKDVFNEATGEPVDLSGDEGAVPKPDQAAPNSPQPTVIEGPKKAIAIDILGAVLGNFKFSYETAVNDWFSIRLDAAHSPNFFWGSGISFWTASLYGRFYFGHYDPWMDTTFNGLGGYFFELGAGLEEATANYSHSDQSGSVFINGSFPPSPMARIVIGDKILFEEKNGVYLEPYVGYEISSGSWSVNYSGTGAYSQPNSFLFSLVEGLEEGTLLGIDFGYAF